MGRGSTQEFETFGEDEIREIAEEAIDDLKKSDFPAEWESRIRAIIQEEHDELHDGDPE